MRHRITHDLSDEQAKKAVQAAIDDYSQRFAKYNVAGRWTGDHTAMVGFAAKGKRLEGEVHLEPGAIVFEMDVPLLLRPFTGKATAKIDEHVGRWIQKAKNGEL